MVSPQGLLGNGRDWASPRVFMGGFWGAGVGVGSAQPLSTLHPSRGFGWCTATCNSLTTGMIIYVFNLSTNVEWWQCLHIDWGSHSVLTYPFAGVAAPAKDCSLLMNDGRIHVTIWLVAVASVWKSSPLGLKKTRTGPDCDRIWTRTSPWSHRVLPKVDQSFFRF